jgi:hypothetical protein
LALNGCRPHLPAKGAIAPELRRHLTLSQLEHPFVSSPSPKQAGGTLSNGAATMKSTVLLLTLALASLTTAASANDYELGATLTFATVGTLDVVFVIKGMGARAGSATDSMLMDPMQVH